MQKTQTKNNMYILTENNNTIVTHKINGYELITLNYVDNKELITIYDVDCNIVAICTFESWNGKYIYDIIKNIQEVDEKVIADIMEQLQEITIRLEW